MELSPDATERQNAVAHLDACIAEQAELGRAAETALKQAEADPSAQEWVLVHWRGQIEWADYWTALYGDRRAELLEPA